jgi:hypothetical protein
MRGKSGIIGFAGGAVTTAAVVAIMGAGAASGPTIGRFEMEATADHSAFLFDTVTGQVWSSSANDFWKAKLGTDAGE